MSECKIYRREIEATADGGLLSPGARAHATRCRSCGDELHARQSLRALVSGLGKVEAPADFEFRLRARMATAKGAGGGGRFGGHRLLYGFAPVAAAACFLVISASLYFRQATRPSPINPTGVSVESAHNAGTEQAMPGIKQGKTDESKDPTRQADLQGQASIKSHSPASAPRTRVRVVRASESASKDEGRANLQPNTAINSIISARVYKPQVMPIAVTEPLRLILRDESGAERVVPMRAVSFGSQNMLARETGLRQAIAAEVEGVW